jgi:hypothetical protein
MMSLLWQRELVTLREPPQGRGFHGYVMNRLPPIAAEVDDGDSLSFYADGQWVQFS